MTGQKDGRISSTRNPHRLIRLPAKLLFNPVGKPATLAPEAVPHALEEPGHLVGEPVDKAEHLAPRHVVNRQAYPNAIKTAEMLAGPEMAAVRRAAW